MKVLFGMREGRFSAGEAGLNVMEDNAKKRGEAILKMLDDPERWYQMDRLRRARLTTEL